jgi:precorrin-6A/cobalt-precorrin-6A reductase
VSSVAAAANALPSSKLDIQRVLVTSGHSGLEHFAARADIFCFVRTIEPISQPHAKNLTLLTARGPYDLAGETHILKSYGIDWLVTKNSGGNATQAKLIAARALKVPVIMIARPSITTTHCVHTLTETLDWLESVC